MSEQTERIIVSWGTDFEGPLLCFFAGIHGNEPAGVLALERVFIKLQELDLPFRGRLIGLRGNLSALRQQQRYVDVDLNRLWSRVEIDRVRRTPVPRLRVEERELLELLSLVEAIRESEYSPQLFVDLHTTSAKGGAFSVVSSYASHRALAECLPVPMIFGLAPALAHTTNKFFEEHGMIGIAFEAGQHDDPISIDRHEAAVWMLLAAMGCMNKEDIPEWELHEQLLEEAAGGLSHYQEVVYRHSIPEGEVFRMMPGFDNFQEVSEGQALAYDSIGEIFASSDGRLLMPLYQPQGNDGFFIIQDLDDPPV